MYELRLVYFTTDLNIIITHEEEFDGISELSDWVKENILDFNFSNNQIVQYVIVKKEVE